MPGLTLLCRAAADSGVVAFDCKTGEEILLIPYALFFPGDNPMQAELASQAGLGCNFFCRTCKAGGTQAEKVSTTGFDSLFRVSCLPAVTHL